MSQRPNVVQAGSGGAGNIFESIVNNWQRKKLIDYRFGKENELMQDAHRLGMERDNNRIMQNMIAEGTGQVIKSHFDNLLEDAKSRNRIGELKEGGRQTRLTKTHGAKRDVKTMKDISSNIYLNSQDNSQGISPLVAGPGGLQNIGPLLKGHPMLGVNPAAGAGNADAGGAKPRKPRKKKAGMPPKTGTGATPDPMNDNGGIKEDISGNQWFDGNDGGDGGGGNVTPAKVKKPRKPRVKKATTGGGLTEIRNPDIETGNRSA